MSSKVPVPPAHPRPVESGRSGQARVRRMGPASSRGLAVGLYLFGLAFLLVAWVFSNPPGAAPDEPSHYIRSLGAAQGVITGHPGGYGGSPGANLAQLADLNDYTRAYPVPAGLAPATFACNATVSTHPASCLDPGRAKNTAGEELSPHASQPPLPYLLAGVFMLHQSTPDSADWAGRSALAVWCLLLIAVPLSLAGKFRGRLLLGLVVAFTPMTIFTGSILNPSGIEIFSSVGFFLSLFAVADGRYPRGALFAAGFTGVFVTMSRPFAPLWVIVGLIAAAGLIGPGELWRGIRRRPWGSGITTVAIGLSTLSTLLFLQLFTSPTATQTSVSVKWPTMEIIGELAVGDFGWLDTPLPMNVAYRWLGVVVLLGILALIFGNRRERITILLTTGLAVGLTYVITLYFLLPVNIGPQGRHFLPVLVLQPLTSVVVLSRQRLPVRLITVGIPVVLMVGLQIVSWISNSYRQGLGKPVTTLGDVPSALRQLFAHADWSPPASFLTWFVFVCFGGLLLVLAATQALLVPAARVPGEVSTEVDATPPVATSRGEDVPLAVESPAGSGPQPFTEWPTDELPVVKELAGQMRAPAVDRLRSK